MRALVTWLNASVFLVLLLASCRLGTKEATRLGLGGRDGSSGAGGEGGMTSSGVGGDAGHGGMSGASTSGDGGSSGTMHDDDAAAAGSGGSDSGSAGTAGTGGSGGTSGSDPDDDAGAAGAGTGGTGGTGGTMSSGLAGCTYDAVQSRSGHDYYFCSNYMSWTVARDICADGGGSLAIVDDADENSFLTEGFGPHPSWWIGANDQTTPDEWHWVDGADDDGPLLCSGFPCSSSSGGYVGFAHDQPSAIGDESCGALQSAGTWSDEYCVVSKPFICELAAP